ncbi:MAG: FeoC-like transcriptional regulator [Magnetococcales bacterium]|nr:FeoC-like transcriptional regulator [Magnetococcales bacterium]MBF0149610.1 FeoC-like transcriptional regulator [Magnetococcales bacterium]
MVTLTELKDFLSRRGRIPLMDLAHHFNKDPAVLRDMLAHWEKKGRVRLTKVALPCSTQCSGCGSGPSEVCEWLDPSQV